MGKIEIGYTVEKERWLEASKNLHEFGQIMARNLRSMNRDGRGQEDADDLMADIMPVSYTHLTLPTTSRV